MAYDPDLAERLRAALSSHPDLAERKMFGGIAFMLAGHMCCGGAASDVVHNAVMQDQVTFSRLLRVPSAALPLAMSLAAFFLIAAVLATVGATHPADEGTPAHIFQLLMVLQVPVALYFASKWLVRAPRPALLVLLLQAGAALLAVATVFWLESGRVI